MDLPATSAFHESLMSPAVQDDAQPKRSSTTNYGRESFPYGISGVAMPDYGYSGSLYSCPRKSFPRKSRVCCYCGKSFTRSTTRRYHEKRCPLLRAAGSLVDHSEQIDNTSERKFFSLGSLSPVSLTSSISPASDTCRIVEDEPPKQPVSNRRRSFDQANLDNVYVKQEPDEFLNLYVGTPLAAQGRPNSGPFLNPESLPQDSVPLPNFPSQSKDVSNGEKSSSLYESGTVIKREPSSDTEPGVQKLENNMGSSDQGLFDNYNEASREMDQMVDESQTTLPVSPKTESLSTQDTQGQSQNPPVLKIERRAPKMINKHRCGLCGKLFDTQKQLQMHEQLHTKFRPYTCRFCGQRFTKSAMRIRHERSHLGEKPFMCIACGTSFTRNYSLKLHEQRRHSRGPCICGQCGKVCESLNGLKAHVQNHDSYESYSTKESSHVTAAVDNYCSDMPTQQVCDNMQLMSNSENSLAECRNNGIDSNCNVDDETKGKVKCDDCGKEFSRPYLLKYHVKVHAGLKPFECPICCKRFGYKNNMKSHLKLHAGIKPYQCYVCDAKFTRGSTLRRHARKHGIIADSIWDLFTNTNVSQSYNAGTLIKPSSSPSSVHSTKTNFVHQIGSIPENSDASQNYDVESVPPVPNGSIYMNFHNKHAGQHVTYPPVPTSTPLPKYTPGSPPLAALNLSMRNASNVNYQSSDMMRLCWEKSPDKADQSQYTEHKRNIGIQVKPVCREFEAQTNLCDCSRKDEPLHANIYGVHVDQSARKDASPTTISNGTSPIRIRLQSNGNSYHDETLSSLVASGRIFVCEHCECYYTEYAMYRIHQKLHAKDENKPYLCPICSEDCHDRMYFTLHISEHLK